MKKLGLVGGVGPASTLEYYKSINEGYQVRIGDRSESGQNPPMVIDSLNLAVAYDLVGRKDWPAFTALFVDAITRLKAAGAEIAAISANTAHIVYDGIVAGAPLPLVGIVDETCKKAKALGCRRLMVFGTGFTMESGMYEAQCARLGLEAAVPGEADRKAIHGIIFPNLEAGIVLEDDKARMLEIARRCLKEYQADGLILGCTELPLIIKPGDLDTTLLDTTAIHIEAILDAMMAE